MPSSSPSEPPAVICENLRKTFLLGEVAVEALKGVSIRVVRGEFLALMGASGSGKSTLLNLMGCLDRPTSGRVLIDGIDTSRLSENELARIRREKIGFIFQQFNLIKTLNALENVALPMVFKGVERSRRISRAEELLEQVGLGDRRYHKPSKMSGGEQQRVAIARALANEPDIIFADEPTGNLDTAAGDMVMEILSGLNREGRTIVIVTHDPEVAERAWRILRMRDGRIVEEKV
ncbi:MAG TPA: ABC transporter ATP-binding protein [Candidatus Syntrophoarchaeum butanivorans]|uniref:ABC transporter ATP-binding protein n=1 Tax=Candidatus Syntropharchaeum butanivorans TaxID=1839936 RepID=A0A7C0X2X3_9EURY|nr:ABC transporter ATP-binding protein [Candidatus Syntrophoarchaeum butanivorans]